MKVLVDTDTLIWWFLDDPRPSPDADALLDDRGVPVFVSAVSVWEIATKLRVERLDGAEALIGDLPSLMEQWHFTPLLPISLEHGRRAGLLAGRHRGPFDRMLAAQAVVEDMGLVTLDTALAGLGARVVW